MIQKLLYAFAAQETLALLEKINAMDSTYDSSYHAADKLLDRGRFNFVERKLLAKALKKVARRETLVAAMNVVVYNNIEGEVKNERDRMYYHTNLGLRDVGGTIPINALQGGVLQSAAQSAWERHLGQTSVLAQQYNQMCGVLR